MSVQSNIVLIGMPGSGKSTVGVLLAKAAGMQFTDTDLLIQAHTGERLQDTIDKCGIDFFLKTEQEVLCGLNISNSVIATGGSAVLSEKAMSRLCAIGKTVFLDVPLCELSSRISNISSRGIAMKQGEDIADVYRNRLPLYRKYADITIDVNNQSIEETVNSVLKQI